MARRPWWTVVAVVAACHEDSIVFDAEEAPIDCQLCDADSGCAPVADGTLCAGGVCADGDCRPSGCTTAARWTAVAAGSSHSCALTLSGTTWCWGRNMEGQLGVGDVVARPAPTLVGATDRIAITAGGKFSCALSSAGDGACWGKNSDGQLGGGVVSPSSTAPQSMVPAPAWREIDAGEDHACGVTDASGLACWGKSTDGGLGAGAVDQSAEPIAVVGSSGSDWRQVSAGKKHTCAIDWDARLWCWGGNTEGQLGAGDTAPRDTPVEIGADTGWVSVSAGATHTCAIDAGGELWCWGGGRDGELGIGSVDRALEPQPVADGPAAWQRVDAGERFSCGLARDGTLWCWGRNDAGQLGLGPDATGSSSPARVTPVDDWIGVAAGRRHVCAVRTLGALYCWGSNTEGQLGLDDVVDRPEPSEVCADIVVVE